MKLDHLEVYHLSIPLVHPFETSFGRVHEKETILIRAVSDGLAGWGEAPAAAAPNYGYETVETVLHVIRDFLAPKLKGQEIAKPGPISDLFASVRGHNMAKAGVEMAVLDLLARQAGRPLHEIVGAKRDEIPTGVSLGIEPRIDALLKRIDEALAAGYRRIKVKIKPRADADVLSEIRKRHPKIPLMADANAAYTLQDMPTLKRLDEFDLLMIEQPLHHEDLVDHAKLQKELRTPICLDESIRSWEEGRKAIELGACRIVNIKPARVGGPFNARALHNICAGHGVPVWCGGLLETGVGRAHNIAVATLPNFTLPGDISASERYFRQDVIDPSVTVTPQGTIRVPQGPGLGYTVLEDRVRKFAVRRQTVLS